MAINHANNLREIAAWTISKDYKRKLLEAADFIDRAADLPLEWHGDGTCSFGRYVLGEVWFVRNHSRPSWWRATIFKGRSLSEEIGRFNTEAEAKQAVEASMKEALRTALANPGGK